MNDSFEEAFEEEHEGNHFFFFFFDGFQPAMPHMSTYMHVGARARWAEAAVTPLGAESADQKNTDRSNSSIDLHTVSPGCSVNEDIFLSFLERVPLASQRFSRLITLSCAHIAVFAQGTV